MFEKIVAPVLEEFTPELIFISNGFDSAIGDKLGGLAVTPKGYGYLTKRLCDICPKIIVGLEGGYTKH